MTNSMEGKVAVVTGASSGIGWSISQRLIESGAKIVAFARNEVKLAELARNFPGKVTPVTGDVTRKEDLERLVDTVRENFGKIDAVIPNAGIARVRPFDASGSDDINEQFSVNFVGAFETVRHLTTYIQPGGAVVFITTFLTKAAIPGLSVYSASKAALSCLTRSLAAELAPEIRVNAVAPGPIATRIWGTVGLDPETLDAVGKQVSSRLFPGAFGKPEDIAGAVAFLCSDSAANIFGHELMVDGGYTCG
ncbi:SDR family oxidoreductase [Rhodoblastus sp.]|jgi:NAD(P)-dependent dehydrogenase (short-subunit alcohol dehydrogenase family)|uniref:SDR family NAD(P)-dependent oxidoreductase n=1 Tax=Rhodoblastus sp. TaxID=1962975 RepID=UPI0025FE6956|nr:SDR family oxidoreductase [Rhodoblastus sp.]